MQLPPKIQKKIDSLKRMTVANGATASEAATASKMIDQIYQKYNLHTNKSHRTSTTSTFDIKHFYDALYDGTLESKVLEFDWDEIAKTILTVDEYMYYVTETHSTWELYMREIHGMENGVDRGAYQRKCYRTLMTVKGIAK